MKVSLNLCAFATASILVASTALANPFLVQDFEESVEIAPRSWGGTGNEFSWSYGTAATGGTADSRAMIVTINSLPPANGDGVVVWHADLIFTLNSTDQLIPSNLAQWVTEADIRLDAPLRDSISLHARALFYADVPDVGWLPLAINKIPVSDGPYQHFANKLSSWEQMNEDLWPLVDQAIQSGAAPDFRMVFGIAGNIPASDPDKTAASHSLLVDNVTIAVPEPSVIALFAAAMPLILGRRR